MCSQQHRLWAQDVSLPETQPRPAGGFRAVVSGSGALDHCPGDHPGEWEGAAARAPSRPSSSPAPPQAAPAPLQGGCYGWGSVYLLPVGWFSLVPTPPRIGVTGTYRWPCRCPHKPATAFASGHRAHVPHTMPTSHTPCLRPTHRARVPHTVPMSHTPCPRPMHHAHPHIANLLCTWLCCSALRCPTLATSHVLAPNGFQGLSAGECQHLVVIYINHMLRW